MVANTRAVLHWMALASPGFLVVSLLLPVSFAFRRRRWALAAFGLLVVQFTAEQFQSQLLAACAGLALEAGSVVFLVRGWRQSVSLHAEWLKRLRAAKPVVLQPPFEGRWKALGTGPWTARNHHLVASDQWFATDWVRVDGESRGSKVLAPVDGLVVHVENRQADKPTRPWIQRDVSNPAGNYVSLRVKGREDVYVILAHLEQGSIQVWPGQEVRAGDLLGCCGNSGNTTRPHLHVHAQPTEQVAPGAVWGVPVVFGERTEWMRRGEALLGVGSQVGA
jgi:murein DD-endopeptidase MepM/ murein hydrolase activator NlpD